MTSGGKAPLRRCPSMGSAFDWGWAKPPPWGPPFPAVRVRPPFQGVPGRGGRAPLAADRPAPAGRARALRDVALAPDRPGLRVLAARPAGEAVPHPVGAVAEAAD